MASRGSPKSEEREPLRPVWGIELYFSIIHHKVLTPNDFATLDAIRLRLTLYEQLSNRTPKTLAWKFTRRDMLNWQNVRRRTSWQLPQPNAEGQDYHDVISETDHQERTRLRIPQPRLTVIASRSMIRNPTSTS